MTNGTSRQDERKPDTASTAETPDSATGENDDGKPAVQPRSHGPLRKFLKLIVEIDSSRFALSRVKAALMLFALLALFAAIGYGVPALLSRYF